MTSVVLVCGDPPLPAVDLPDAVVIDGLCRDPALITPLDIKAARIVLVLHRYQYHLPAVQKALRSIDVDPLGAQILDVGDERSAASLRDAVAGSRARAVAFAGSSPENAKPVLSGPVTRRGFLTPPSPVYVAAPRVDHATCAANGGCRQCVDVCPQEAYRWQAGRIAYDKEACVPCGRCVTSCPTGAIDNPALTPAMLDAQIRQILHLSAEPVGVRFVCSRGSIEPTDSWREIVVPCTSMVPGTWLLGILLLGAGAAYAIPCGDCACPLGLDAGAIQSNDLAHAMLTESGFDPAMASGTSVLEPIGHYDIEEPFDLHRAPDVVTAFAAAAGHTISIAHPAADTGSVEIDASVCTLCGQCAQICPTKALAEEYDGDTVAITFDANVCVNCAQCVSACPEIEQGAITVVGRVDVDLFAAGRHSLHEGQVAECEVCGKAIAPAAMMDRIGDLLGEEFEPTMKVVLNRCLDCRGRW